MKRKFRLTKATDFKRVRRFGKSYAHPLVVLIISPNELDKTRFGVAVSKAVGNAVQRNKTKRQLREILRGFLPQVITGWDVVIIARRRTRQASFDEIQPALYSLLRKADLITPEHSHVN